ncbi:MAG TPA: tRNA (adenosine(37)-N6)-threonylcarbamoyltransferase complex dimerization subunit type 1 TsaB [Pyrinomonadaceae bacterium]|nr:tRNA (adenosine(37)-N6)-threonylcarbamoyltransferase complex dimerization subunit type 1 TsaB [Pyrinomonadaceae bacterium]
MSSEPLILAMETATRAGSVCLALGNEILASVAGDASASHSNDLIQNMQRVLKASGRELSAVDFFAAAEGPGSFTGLRIGLATAKALATSMQKKCAGVSTLAAVAAAAGPSERTVALLPAGRGEVFAQMFKVTNDHVEALDAATHIPLQALVNRYGNFGTLRWAGEGAHLQIELIRGAAAAHGNSFDASLSDLQVEGWGLAPEQSNLAGAVARLARGEWQAGRLISPQDLRANYLRASDAELKDRA